jgi:hypothetical protein
LAATTRPRSGVTRKVWVTVWWRNSVAIPRMPSSRAAPDNRVTGPATSMGKLSADSGGAPWRSRMLAATVRTAKAAMAAARP